MAIKPIERMVRRNLLHEGHLAGAADIVSVLRNALAEYSGEDSITDLFNMIVEIKSWDGPSEVAKKESRRLGKLYYSRRHIEEIRGAWFSLTCSFYDQPMALPLGPIAKLIPKTIRNGMMASLVDNISEAKRIMFIYDAVEAKHWFDQREYEREDDQEGEEESADPTKDLPVWLQPRLALAYDEVQTRLRLNRIRNRKCREVFEVAFELSDLIKSIRFPEDHDELQTELWETQDDSVEPLPALGLFDDRGDAICACFDDYVQMTTDSGCTPRPHREMVAYADDGRNLDRMIDFLPKYAKALSLLSRLVHLGEELESLDENGS